MSSITPKLKAVVVSSGTIHGEFSLRVIKDGSQVPMQLQLRDAGFVPGDVVLICLLNEYEGLEQTVSEKPEENEEIDSLRDEISGLEDTISRAISILENGW